MNVLKEWPAAVIVAVVLAFAFLFWLVEFKGIIPSEVGFGSAKLKFAEAHSKELASPSESTPPTTTPSTPSTTVDTSSVKPNLPAAQGALSTQTQTSTTNNTSTSTPAANTTTTTSTPATTIPAKPTGFGPRQVMTKYFQYIQDGQYQAAYNLFKAQENGAQQTYEEFENFWKSTPSYKWTVTKDYESGNFAWVDLTLNTPNSPKPQTWKYSFKRNTQNPDLKPFGFWGVSNIEPR